VEAFWHQSVCARHRVHSIEYLPYILVCIKSESWNEIRETAQHRDEASFYAMVELFLSIPIESQCCQSYGVCGAQFETDVTFDK